jgi:uncharacterized membrane protein
MNRLSPELVIAGAGFVLIVIGLISMVYQRAIKVTRRKSRGETKPLFSAPDSLGADSGCIPGIIGMILVVLGILLLILLAGQYVHDHPFTPVPTPESFRSLFM